jgi:hypothetical protein
VFRLEDKSAAMLGRGYVEDGLVRIQDYMERLGLQFKIVVSTI